MWQRVQTTSLILEIARRDLERDDEEKWMSHDRSTSGLATSRGGADAAVLHNLVKLSCRIAEYQSLLSLADESAPATQNPASPTMSKPRFPKTNSWEMTLGLLVLQRRLCGERSLTHSSVSLCYSALAQGQAHQRRSGAPSSFWRRALECTEAFSLVGSQRGGHSQGSTAAHQLPAARVGRLLLPQHCEMYFSLFGWEHALSFWMLRFPHTVVSYVSDNPKAFEHCLLESLDREL